MNERNSSKVSTNVKNIFTLYDIFGYLIPGATFVILIWIGLHPEILKYLIGLSYSVPTIIIILSKYWTIWIIIGLVITYILGHIIASISSMLFEKIIIGECLKYPTYNMLPQNIIDEHLGSKLNTKNKREKGVKKLNNILLGYRGSMGNETVKIFCDLFVKKFGEQGKSILLKDKFNIFVLCFSSIKETCPLSYERIINYVSAYGFSRNSSMVFFLAAIIVSILKFNLLFMLTCLIIAFFLFRQYLKFLRRVNDETFYQFMVLNWDNCNKYK